MAKAWSSWLPDLLPHLPACPAPLVEHEVKRAAQILFERARAWRVTQAAVAVAAGTESVTIAPSDSGQSLVRIEEASYDGQTIDAQTAEELAEKFGEDWLTRTGTPTDFFQDTPGVIRLVPIPDADASTGLVARISVKPSEAATGIPDDQYVKFREDLTTGAKARLMAYLDKPWTNLQMAGTMASAFEAAIDCACAQAAFSFGRARIASRPKWC